MQKTKVNKLGGFKSFYKKSISNQIMIPLSVLIILTITAVSYILKIRFESDLLNTANIKVNSEIQNVEDQLQTTNNLMLEQVKTAVQVLREKSLLQGTPATSESFVVKDKTVPGLYFGSQLMNDNYSLVDNVVNITGGTATLFVKSGSEFVRVSTNVVKDDGTRAIGTILDPKGLAIKEITKGNSFYGLVEILGSFYITGYEPIKADGETIGIWYCGYPVKSLDVIGEKIHNSKILDNGFLALLDKKNNILFNSNHVNLEEIKQIISQTENEEWEIKKEKFDSWGFEIVAGIYNPDIQSSVMRIQFVIIGFSVLFLFLVLFIIYIIVRKQINKRLSKLIEISNKVSIGDTDVEIDNQNIDELGLLEKSYSEMISNMREQTEMAKDIASGNLNVAINIRSDKDRLSKSFITMIQSLKKLIDDIKLLTSAAVEGNLSYRINPDNHPADFKQIVQGINKTVDEILEPINEGSEVLSQISKGNLKVRVNGKYKGEHQKIKNSINEVAQSLYSIVGEVASGVDHVSSSSSQISSSIDEMLAVSREQSIQTNEIAAAMEEMAKTILENTKNASAAAQTAKESGVKANEGEKVVLETIDGMNQISVVVNSSAETVFKLGEDSDKIGEIIQVIQDIADQTNLLALNASIEAARAGEQGRGFAVVADEVLKLAERTSNATREISEMIKGIQIETGHAVDSIKQGTSAVNTGKQLAEKAGEVLEGIKDETEKLSSIADHVAVASEEQSSAAEQISKNIESISNVTSQNAQSIQQIAQAAANLNNLTINLERLVAKFDLGKHRMNNSFHSKEQFEENSVFIS